MASTGIHHLFHHALRVSSTLAAFVNPIFNRPSLCPRRSIDLSRPSRIYGLIKRPRTWLDKDSRTWKRERERERVGARPRKLTQLRELCPITFTWWRSVTEWPQRWHKLTTSSDPRRPLPSSLYNSPMNIYSHIHSRAIYLCIYVANLPHHFTNELSPWQIGRRITAAPPAALSSAYKLSSPFPLRPIQLSYQYVITLIAMTSYFISVHFTIFPKT